MANPFFNPVFSSNEVWYGQVTDVCLTDVVDGKAEANHTHDGYAESGHTHEGTYAAFDHTHTPATIGAAPASHTHDGYAESDHGHSYNDLTDKPTIPAAYSHPASHPASMITGLSEVATSGSYEDLTDKPTIPAAYTHPANHPASMITGLAEVATTNSYNDLDDKPTIPAAYSHPASHPASMITGLAEVATSGSYEDLTNKPTIPTIPSSLPANGGNADTLDNKHASDFADASHTHDYAASNHEHPEQVVMHGITSAGTGAAYTATVEGVTALTAGVSFIMVPHVVSTAVMPTLNVNGLGAKSIRRRISNSTVSTTTASSANWLGAGKPIRMTYDGTFWIADWTRPNAADLYGIVSIEHGGTGADTAEEALTALGAFPATGGDIDGDTNVKGVLRVQSQQAFHYDTTASSQIIGTNNATGGTTICAGPAAPVIVNGAYLKTAQIEPRDTGSYSIGSADNRYYSAYLRVSPNVSSDQRLKRDIAALDNADLAAFIEKLNVVSYNYNDDDVTEDKRIGLIAQDVIAADPEIAKAMVEQSEDGFYSLRPADLVFPLIAAVQALSKRVAELEAK